MDDKLNIEDLLNNNSTTTVEVEEKKYSIENMRVSPPIQRISIQNTTKEKSDVLTNIDSDALWGEVIRKYSICDLNDCANQMFKLNGIFITPEDLKITHVKEGDNLCIAPFADNGQAII